MALQEGPAAFQSLFFGELADATGCATTLSRATAPFTPTFPPGRSQGTFPASGAFLDLPAVLQPREHRLCIPRDLPAPPWQIQVGTTMPRVCQHLPGHCQPWEAFPWGGNQGKLSESSSWIRFGPSLGLLSQFQGCPLVTLQSPLAQCHLSRVAAAWVDLILFYFWCSSVLYF